MKSEKEIIILFVKAAKHFLRRAENDAAEHEFGWHIYYTETYYMVMRALAETIGWEMTDRDLDHFGNDPGDFLREIETREELKG